MKNNCTSLFISRRIHNSLRIISILFFFLLSGIISAQSVSNNKKQARISISVKNKSLKDVLKEIEKKSQYIFIYNDNVIDASKLIDVNAKEETIEQVLVKVLAGTSTSYKITDRQIVIYKDNEKKVSNSESLVPINVSGMVVDEDNQPLAGVTVGAKGTSTTTATDLEGRFILNLAKTASTLSFSYVGYKTQEIALRKNMKVVLKEDSKLIEEVVVIGYGSVKKNDLTGSVSSLKEKDFNKGVLSSPTEMLQGRVAGVQITNNGGEPGAGVSVRVRGTNSIRSGQDPLYVVDGVPLDITDVQANGASTTGVGDASAKNPLNFLNPDDIASIDVLKDASATAIYGSRGSNGVIIITTKRGSEGKSQVSYSGYAGISVLPKKYDVLSASEFNAARTKLNLSSADAGYSTDWQDEIFRTAMVQNHNLSIVGGNKSSSYRASLGYMDQDGIINKTGLKKYSGRLNVTTKAFNDRLTLEIGMTAARTNDQRAPLGETGGVEGDLILSALKLNPTYPVYNEDGTYYQVSDQVRNPVAMINLTNDNTQTDRLLANLTATLRLIKGLNYKVNLSVDEVKVARKVTQDAQLSYMENGGTASIGNVEKSSKMIENYLTYDFTSKNNIHKFNLLAGHSYQKFRRYSYSFTENGFASGKIDYLNDLELGNYTKAITTSDITVDELQSFFGRINYNLMEKYLLTVNFRADGSSKFGTDNKYGYFPSAALAWRASEEEFIKKLDVFSSLKLRLGWGITGNQEIISKQSQATLGTVAGASLDGGTTVVPGYTVTRTPNTHLKWEQSKQYNAGIDFGILKGRLTGTVDMFYKTTSNLLFYKVAAGPSLGTNVYTNLDIDLINKGYEFALNGVIVAKKDLNWTVNANFSKDINRVKNYPYSKVPTGYPSGPGITGTPTQYIINNEPLGTFWGKTFIGYDANGKSLYQMDANGTSVEGVIGHALPDFTYNFGTNISWKQFDLGVNFNGVYGNDVYNNLANIMDQMTLFSSGWNTTPGALTSGQSTSDVLSFSSKYIEDGSFLRLSNATLGYSVSLPREWGISRLRAYVSGANLFVISKYSGYDPEMNVTRVSNGVPAIGIGWTTYPKARTFTMGVNIEF